MNETNEAELKVCSNCGGLYSKMPFAGTPCLCGNRKQATRHQAPAGVEKPVFTDKDLENILLATFEEDRCVVTWEKLRDMALNGEISYEEVLNGAEKKFDLLKSRINELIAERYAAKKQLIEYQKEYTWKCAVCNYPMKRLGLSTRYRCHHCEEIQRLQAEIRKLKGIQ